LGIGAETAGQARGHGAEIAEHGAHRDRGKLVCVAQQHELALGREPGEQPIHEHEIDHRRQG
jgi:hypothetical protein